MLISEKQKAKEAWDNPQKVYEDEGLVRRLNLLRILFSIKLSQCQSMEGYVTKIITTAQQIVAISKPTKDEFLAVLMLNGLPVPYEPIVIAPKNSVVDLTSDLVKSKLLQEDIKLDKNKEVALATKSIPYNKRFILKCYKCNYECNSKNKKQYTITPQGKRQ
ncbi:hypothetical protein ILUMI_13832 [Ignelater luminosus]|uniref:Uncharacterized protein n=1 Tax=Ignelater luminosus TaxID=2038154 RepID=A0A8K0CRM4_IGNLU|nr:hypothetical protein ILUMI_13832 [Ignelater luminosus]